MYIGGNEEGADASDTVFMPRAMHMPRVDSIDVTLAFHIWHECAVEKVSKYIDVRYVKTKKLWFGKFRVPKVVGLVIRDVEDIREMSRRKGFPLRGIVSVREVLRAIHEMDPKKKKLVFGRYAKKIESALFKQQVTVSL